MLGTLVNTGAIFLGSLLGLFLKNGISQKYKAILRQATGLSILFVGAGGAIHQMLSPLVSPILFIVSLVVGGVLGTFLGIERQMERLGAWLQNRLHFLGGGGSFSKGFVTASLLFCVGSMAILGPLESGLKGEHSILLAKSVLDAVLSLVMASTFGVGVLFSGAAVFLYQGSITLLAFALSPYLTADMLRELSLVGGILIFALGLNSLDLAEIKVGNLLPAVLVPVFYYGLRGLF